MYPTIIAQLKNSSLRGITSLFVTALLFTACENETTSETSEVVLENATVTITTPINQQTILPGDQVTFSATVSGLSTSDGGVQLRWSSDVDGTLEESTLVDGAIPSFSTANLSRTIHTIRLTLSNTAGDEIYDEILVYNAIRLFEIENKSSTATLSWSKAISEDFEAYELYRSPYENNLNPNDATLIYATSNLSDTLFFDSTARLGQRHFYKVFVKRRSLSPQFLGSNMKTVENGEFLRINFPISKMLSDPTREYVYALVNTDGIYSNNGTGYGIAFIDVATKTIKKRILTDLRCTDLAMDPTRSYLYVCSRSNQVHKINLNTQEVEGIFTMAHPAHKIEVGNNQRLYYHITPPTSGSTQFRMYDLQSEVDVPYQSTMTAANSSFRHGDFELDQNNRIYHGESNSSSSKLSKIGTTNDSFSLLDQWDSRNYRSPQIILNNGLLYWNELLLDTEFNYLGNFTHENQEMYIQAVSPDGEKALASGSLFATQNQNLIQSIPSYFETSAFIDDTTIIFSESRNDIGDTYSGMVFFYDL